MGLQPSRISLVLGLAYLLQVCLPREVPTAAHAQALLSSVAVERRKVGNLWESHPGEEESPSSFLPLHNTLVHSGIKYRSAEYYSAAWQLLQTRLALRQARFSGATDEQVIERSSAALSMDEKAVLSEMYGLSYGSGSYFILLALGTPPQVMSVQFDTGSTLLWVSCDCVQCPTYSDLVPKQLLVPFSAKNSSSVSTVECQSKKCQELSAVNSDVNPTVCTQGSCPFSVQYMDQSTASGQLLQDLATLPAITGPNDVISADAVFGCASKQTGNLVTSNNTLGGLMGAGVTEDSLLAQLAKQGVLAFALSFCLDSSNYTGSHLILGRGPAPKSIKETPLIINTVVDTFGYNTTLPYYYVGLVEFQVGSVPIASSQGLDVFQFNGSGGVILDSGTTYTLVPTQVFQDLVAQLESATSYQFVQVSSGSLCVVENGPINLSKFPPIYMVFSNGVRWRVQPSSYMSPIMDFQGASSTCLGILDTGTGVLGPQITVGETFLSDSFVQLDVERKLVRFAPMNCSTGDFFQYVPSFSNPAPLISSPPRSSTTQQLYGPPSASEPPPSPQQATQPPASPGSSGVFPLPATIPHPHSGHPRNGRSPHPPPLADGPTQGPSSTPLTVAPPPHSKPAQRRFLLQGDSTFQCALMTFSTLICLFGVRGKATWGDWS